MLKGSNLPLVESVMLNKKMSHPLVYTINTRFAEILERHLHTKYNRKQSNLEWFRLSPVEVSDIIHYVETLISEKGNQ